MEVGDTISSCFGCRQISGRGNVEDSGRNWKIIDFSVGRRDWKSIDLTLLWSSCTKSTENFEGGQQRGVSGRISVICCGKITVHILLHAIDS